MMLKFYEFFMSSNLLVLSQVHQLLGIVNGLRLKYNSSSIILNGGYYCQIASWLEWLQKKNPCYWGIYGWEITGEENKKCDAKYFNNNTTAACGVTLCQPLKNNIIITEKKTDWF